MYALLAVAPAEGSSDNPVGIVAFTVVAFAIVGLVAYLLLRRGKGGRE